MLIGVQVYGTKQLVAVADGYRESTGSWVDLLRDCKRRRSAPRCSRYGDGALGFWAALRGKLVAHTTHTAQVGALAAAKAA